MAKAVSFFCNENASIDKLQKILIISFLSLLKDMIIFVVEGIWNCYNTDMK